MTDHQSGIALIVLGGLSWVICSVGLICYGIAWSRRHPVGAFISILLGLFLVLVGTVAILSAPHWSGQ